MSYLAILGRQPEFSLVELESLTGRVDTWGETAVTDQHLDIGRLGGVVKLGRIIDRQPYSDLDNLTINLESLPRFEGKCNFGVSIYGTKVSPARLKAFGLELKKRMKDFGSVRLVSAAGNELTAAQLKYNQIPTKGFELLIAIHDGKAILALTEQYQDIDWYSKRDYDRPQRSAKVGMLPPKLAQILINTTHSDYIYDPFCGTGVILQEALLMGRQAAGSDLSADMTAASQANLEWLAKQTGKDLKWQLEQADARTVTIPPGAAIVSEGYLGPNLHPGQAISHTDKTQLSDLYRDALSSWARQLEPGAEVTICLPVWGSESLPIIDQLTDLGYTLKDFVALNSRKLIYRRPDQSVGRQVLILKRS